MADISAGQHADIALQANEVLRVVTEGNTDVIAVYGAPAGTTPVNSASIDFGPYGVPAKLQVNCNTGRASYYLNTYAPAAAADNGAAVIVLPTDSGATIKSKIETINAAAGITSGVEWPEGVGRRVELPAKRLITPELYVSQAQSIRAVKGSTILTHDGSAVTDRGGDVGAFITVRDDYRGKNGIDAKGVYEDLDIDASATLTAPGPTSIHGYYMPARSGSGVAHSLRNVGVYKAKTDGIHADSGNNRLVAREIRSESAGGTGIYLAGSDCKASDVSSVANKTALEVSGAAIEVNKFDLWRSSSPNTAFPTVKITGGVNGVVFNSGTIEGKTLYIGKNENNANKYLNSHAKFIATHFKFKGDVFDCLFECQSADMVELISCKWGWSGNDVITPLDYLIKITGATPGMVKVVGASGMMRFVGRPGAANKMVLDCGKHICDQPGRLLFEWGRMGTVEFVPVLALAGSAADGSLKTHLPFDGGAITYNVADYPFGWLNLQAYLGNTSAALDTAPATFTMPELPALSSYIAPGLRYMP